MAQMGTIRASEITDHVVYVEDPQQLVELLARRMQLR